MNMRVVLTHSVAAGVGGFLAWYFMTAREYRELLKDYNSHMNGLFDSIPDSQKADFRSEAEIARNPRPREWQL